MDGFRFLRSTQAVILGVCIVVATVGASTVLSRGFIQFERMTREQITVTGSANKQITSDYVVWQASVTVRDPELSKGYKRLAADLDKVKQYLVAKGLREQDLIIPQVVTEQLYKKDEHGNDTNEFMDNRFTQLIEVRSEDVAKLTQVSREITELIDQGVQLNSEAPEYMYRKLDELKLEMLAQATENAKERAENMAKATGNRIGAIRSAKMGVFQITPSTSTDVADMGINDTSSLEKRISAVVTASFAID
jgi:uncharacterized protein